jgi:hypothetical protein
MVKYTQQESAAWHLADRFGIEPHTVAVPHINALRSSQSGKFDNMKRCIASYEFGSRNANKEDQDEPSLKDGILAVNHARNVVDTVHAKLCKSRTLPMALTNGGGALERQRAKDLEKALHGELRKNDIDAIQEDVIRDGLVTSIGWAHVLHGRSSLTIDWVPSDDILFDRAEARTRKIRSIFRRVMVDRWVLLDQYGKTSKSFHGTKGARRKAIREAGTKTGQYVFSSSATNDITGNLIEVWLGWHLRSDNDDDEEIDHDGRYGVFIDGATLEFSPWHRKRLPFMSFVPNPRMRGLHGIAMMADLLPQQQELDKITERVQASYARLGGTHLLVPKEANIETRQLNNGQGTVIEYEANGAPAGAITELNPQFASQQAFDYRNGIIQEMLTSKGIPQMAATGQLPPGLNGASAKAMNSAEEESAERLLIPHRAKERFVLGLSWLVIDEAAAMVKTDKKYAVKSKGERRGLEKVLWKDVLMDHEEFDLDLFPINALAKSPSAKFAQLTEMMKAGAINTEQFRRLFELPDLEAENEVDMADIELVDKLMDLIVIKGEAVQPEPFDYLKLIVTRGRKFYNVCRRRGVPEERLALLRDYLTRAKELDEAEEARKVAAQAAAAAPAPAPAAGPTPMPAPMPRAAA